MKILILSLLAVNDALGIYGVIKYSGDGDNWNLLLVIALIIMANIVALM